MFLHWGIEDTYCASPEQHSLAQGLVGAGADIIVGSHAHRVFGAGHLGPSLVAYGLGNFVYFREDGQSGSSGVLLVRATGRRVDAYSWVPARIRHGIPVPESGGAAVADVDLWAERRTLQRPVALGGQGGRHVASHVLGRARQRRRAPRVRSGASRPGSCP